MDPLYKAQVYSGLQAKEQQQQQRQQQKNWGGLGTRLSNPYIYGCKRIVRPLGVTHNNMLRLHRKLGL